MDSRVSTDDVGPAACDRIESVLDGVLNSIEKHVEAWRDLLVGNARHATKRSPPDIFPFAACARVRDRLSRLIAFDPEAVAAAGQNPFVNWSVVEPALLAIAGGPPWSWLAVEHAVTKLEEKVAGLEALLVMHKAPYCSYRIEQLSQKFDMLAEGRTWDEFFAEDPSLEDRQRLIEDEVAREFTKSDRVWGRYSDPRGYETSFSNAAVEALRRLESLAHPLSDELRKVRLHHDGALPPRWSERLDLTRERFASIYEGVLLDGPWAPQPLPPLDEHEVRLNRTYFAMSRFISRLERFFPTTPELVQHAQIERIVDILEAAMVDADCGTEPVFNSTGTDKPDRLPYPEG